jgi:hypothetical protein
MPDALRAHTIFAPWKRIRGLLGGDAAGFAADRAMWSAFLRIFLDVARGGSLRYAARACNVG